MKTLAVNDSDVTTASVTDASHCSRDAVMEQDFRRHLFPDDSLFPAPAAHTEIIYPVRDGARLMIVSSVEGPTRIFELKKTLALKVEYTDEGVFVEHRKLALVGYGENLREALSELCEMFEVQWGALVEGDPDELTEGARIAADKFRAFAEPVSVG